MATFQFEDILPWGTTGGDTGLSSRMKLKRNFDKIKLYLEALPDFDGILANIMTLQSYFNGGAALQAVKLKTARSLWGQTFDGSADVTGTLQSVADIEMTGALKMAFGNSWFEQKLDANGDLQLSGNVYALGAVSALGVSAAGIDTGGGGGGATSLSELSDTAISLPMSAGQALVFDNGKWRNRLLAWSDLSGKPATFPPSEHSADHDVRYYIENGTIHLGSGSITPITSHQSLAAYTPTANYQALNIKVGSTVVGTYAPTQALNFSIAAGSNISVTADATNKKITIANTYSYTHPTGGANTTITAANGKVLSAITVNNLGHVTSVSSKTLGTADIPDLSNIYLPKAAGESNPTTNSLYVGSVTGRGVFVKDPAGNYVPAFYQNGENLWIGSTQTLDTHHRGQTYISAGYDGAHGNKTIYVCVPNDSNNGGTNYGVWHSGNDGSGSGLDADLLDGHDSGYFATTAALTTLAGTVSTQGGRITTLEGYFDNGVANSAKRLSGTASYTAWGQTYWENGVPKGNVNGDLVVIDPNGNNVTDSAKIRFGNIADDANTHNCPYIQGISIPNNATYGRRRLGFFTTNATVDDTGWVEALSILPNGNIGIGTITPREKLEVGGNIMATGAVSCLGTSAEGSEVTGAVYLRDLQDVLITGTPQTNYVLTFNGSKWVPQASQGGDMSQYVTNTQLSTTLASYATQTWVENLYMKKSDKAGLFTQFANYDGAVQITIGGTQKSLTIAYANAAGSANTAVNADKLDNHHASDFAFASALGNYLPLTAGTDKPLTGILWMDNNLVMANPNHTTNNDSTKIAFYTNKNYPNISPYIQALYEADHGRKRLSVFQKDVADWDTPQTEVLSVMPDGTLRLTQAISFKGTKATYNMISFIDNKNDQWGNGIAIGGGGATIIGGGESAATMIGGLPKVTVDGVQVPNAGSEVMYIGNDANVSIFTNLGTSGGWANRKEFYFGTDGNLTMENASYIRFKNTSGTAQRLVGITSSNQFLLGFDSARSGYETYLDGKYISIRTLKDGDTSVTERIRITAAGDVGIGTSQPGQKLHVNGNIAGDSLWLPVAGSVYINDKNMLTYNSSQMLSLGYGMRNDTGTKTDIYGKQVEIKEQKLKIGDCIIEWDSTHGMLKFSNGIYSMGAVSALGVAGGIDGQVTKPMTFAADVTIGQYTQNGLNKSYKLCFGDNSHYLFKSGNNIQVFGSTVFQSAVGMNSDLDVAGDINAESDVTVGGNLNLGEEGYIYAVGDELFWYAFSTGTTKKIAFV